MIIEGIIFYLVVIAAFLFLGYNLKRLYSYLKVAKPEIRWDNSSQRFAQAMRVAFGQSKIFRDKYAGPLHAGIFWGFLMFLFAASDSIFSGLLMPFGENFSWNFLGPVYTLISFSVDIFTLVIIGAVTYAIIRRRVIKVERLRGGPEEIKDAMIVLGSILVITVSLLFENAILNRFEEWAFMPFATAFGKAFGLNILDYTIGEVAWWIHIIAILAFANYLPYSKHLHVYTSILNVYFSPIGPVNKLEKIDFEKLMEEGAEKFGVSDIDDFSWKALFDGYSCTHCGRCTSVCPANLTGKELSPREIIIQIRERTEDYAPIILKQKNGQDSVQLTEQEKEIMQKKLSGDYESIEALWQCTTCGACMHECPVNIEHVPWIVGMRRSLVMTEAEFPAELQSAFGNLENNSTPWAFSSSERADWAEGLDIKTAAEHPDFEYLFWIGCAGSFDDRSKKIAVAMAKLLKAAGINFAILGTEEQCNGDPARRAGNEYLADMLVKMNLETLNRYNVKKIITFCPHCFNTFKNEYPDFGGNFEVYHHSEFLDKLIKAGKFKFKSNQSHRLNVGYHDSCYLSRYNLMTQEPREALNGIPGVKVMGPERSGDRGLCCGAGGGQMFMEETKGKRVNVERTEELLSLGAKTLAVNCPFCMTMITDGVKSKDMEDVQVKDIAELLLENIELPEEDASLKS